MNSRPRGSIWGTKISKRKAFKGLGDPSTWQSEQEDLEARLSARPIANSKPTKVFNLSGRTLNALQKAGINPLRTLFMTDRLLLKVAGIGDRSVAEIRKKVKRKKKRRAPRTRR